MGKVLLGTSDWCCQDDDNNSFGDSEIGATV